MRVGLDLVAVDSIRDSLDAHGPRFLARVYTEREVADCRAGGQLDPQRLAARFAAKEAVFKVLRVADEAVPWTDIEVRPHASGWVEVALSGQAARLAAAAGITDLELSVAHEHGCAAAVVIAQTREAADR